MKNTKKVTDAELMELMDGVLKDITEVNSILSALETVAGLMIKAIEDTGIELDVIQRHNALHVTEERIFPDYCIQYKRADLITQYVEELKFKHQMELEGAYEDDADMDTVELEKMFH